MPDVYKALAAVDLPIVAVPPEHVMSPLSNMVSAEDAPVETLIYTVPSQHQAIIKMIICTSDESDQDITLRCYSADLGPIPLFGPVRLAFREWAEWAGSLTLSEGAEIRGAVTSGSASIAVYGLERAP